MRAIHCKAFAILATAMIVQGTATAADPTAADRSFLSDAGTSNQKEIDVSKMAEQHADSKAVKSFAATMVRDHTQLGAKMKAKFGDAVGSSASPTPPELAGKSGHEFDKAYMDLMVSDHATVVDKFQQAATGSDHSAAVHKAAAGALPTIKHHAAMAKSIDAKL